MTGVLTAFGHPPFRCTVKGVDVMNERFAPSPDLDALFDEYRATCDVAVRNRLVVAYTWLADRCARRFAQRGEPLADLRQVARIGLVKAVERFQPERGVSFVSFATPTVTGEIKRYFRDHTWAVWVPRTTKDVRSLVTSTFETLEQELDRAPTSEEIAAYTGVRTDAVESALHANSAYRTSSIDALDRSDRPSPATDAGDRAVEIAAREALRQLDDRTRTIMYLRFYEDCTQREIGERVGVGQVQVSRLIRSAFDELREHLEPVAANPS